MSAQLRPYQAALVAEVRQAAASGTRAVLMQLGTGGGKTATAAEILASATRRGRRCVFAAHLDSLVGDTHARLSAAGVRAGFIQAGRPSDPEALVQVASLPTLHVRGERPPADLFVLDEAHRAMGPTVRAILDAYPAAFLLGLTATPQRGDSAPLGDVFEAIVSGPSNAWLTAQGFLAPADVLAPAAFNESALADDPVTAYERHTPGSRAIVFAANTEHAADLARRFEATGYPAACIIGETPREERERLREAVTRGEVLVLVGVGVFIEGFDLPAIETVILARPFSVTGSYLQAIGRGLRPSPSTGKTKCTVLDLRGSVHLHGLPDDDRVWSLSGAAVRRADTLMALRRCGECFAIFKTARSCPRCGATAAAIAKLPRVLTQAEKLEVWNQVPAAQRDARYLAKLVAVAATRMRMPPHRAQEWAARQFQKRFGRSPERSAA